MNKHHEKAKTLFAAHSKKETLHFTADGQAFFENNPARNHAKSLDDKSVVTLERHEVIEETPESADEQENESQENEGQDDQQDAKTSEGKAKTKAKADEK